MTESGQKLVLVYLPVVKLLNDQDRTKHDANIEIFRELAASSSNVDFVDLNSGFEERNDLMYDGIHLNAKGKKVVSKALASVLTQRNENK